MANLYSYGRFIVAEQLYIHKLCFGKQSVTIHASTANLVGEAPCYGCLLASLAGSDQLHGRRAIGGEADSEG